MISAGSIKFHYLSVKPNLTEKVKLKKFIIWLLSNEGKKVDTINYIFCDDAYLLSVNRQYLQHNTFTDIITFELQDEGQPVLSDIFISVERVKENAMVLLLPFEKELLRVIFHGALHLSGYNDKSDSDKSIMTRKEDYYLNHFQVSRETDRHI